MQYCKRCNQMKDESDFYPIRNSYVDKRVWCKACADKYRVKRAQRKAIELRRVYRSLNELRKKQLELPPLFRRRKKRSISYVP